MAITLRLPDELTAQLRETAEREGASMQATAIRAIEQYVNRRTERRDALLTQTVERDASLLKRLADL